MDRRGGSAGLVGDQPLQTQGSMQQLPGTVPCVGVHGYDIGDMLPAAPENLGPNGWWEMVRACQSLRSPR